MATVATSTIKLDVNSAPALAALRQFGDKWSGTMQTLSHGIGLLKTAAGAVGSVVSQMSALSKEAAEADAIERKLTAALRLHGAASLGMLPAIQQYTTALMTQLAIDDEDIAKVQTKLLALGVLPKQLKAATEATYGLAAATGQEAAAAAKAVAGAYQGRLGALSKIGIRTKDAAEAIELLRSKFDLLVSEKSGIAGDWGRLEVAIGNVREAAGSVVNRLVEGSGALDRMIELAQTLDRTFSGMAAEGGAVDGVKSVLQKAWKFLEDSVTEVTDQAFLMLRPDLAVALAESRTPPNLPVGPPSSLKPAGIAPGFDSGVRGVKGKTAGMSEGDKWWPQNNAGLRAELAQVDAELKAIAGQNDAYQAALKRKEEIQARHLEAMSKGAETWATTQREQHERERLALGGHVQTLYLFGAEMIGALAVGEAGVGQAAKAFFGSLLSTVGSQMISMGVAAIGLSKMMSTLGIPVVGAVAGAAAIGIGTALVAGGGALRASAASNAHSSAGASAPSAAPYRSSFDYRPQSATSNEPKSVVYNVHFGAVVGGRSDAEIGREIARYVKAGERAGWR